LKNLCNILLPLSFSLVVATIIFIFLNTALDAAVHRWGTASVEFDGVFVTLNNELTTGGDLDFNVDMTEGDVTIKVVVMQGQGDTPDTMYVIPPEGYIAIPEMVTVEETEKGTIMVVQEGMS